MKVKEFLQLSLDSSALIAIYDYNSDYDYVCEKETNGNGGFVYDGWIDEIDKFTDPKLVEKWLESDVEDWNYVMSNNYCQKILCLNIATDSF